MYVALFYTHRIVVTLFLFHYVYKLALLLLNKTDKLELYRTKTAMAERIVSVLFLVTGVWMMALGVGHNMMQYIKLVCVFASIPLAIVGFKKGNKVLATASIVLLIAAYGLAEMAKAKAKKAIDTSAVESVLEKGKIVYGEKCTTCHGDKGDAGVAGAANLAITKLSDDELKKVIKNGRNAMAAYPNLTDDQLDGLVVYIHSLKQ